MSAPMPTHAMGDPRHHEQGRRSRSRTHVRDLRPERFLFEPLERRTLFTITTIPVELIGGLRTVTVLTTGDNTFTINHDGAGGNTVIAGGATQTNVDILIIRCGGGKDKITYNITSAVQHDYTIDADLGGGDDAFTANLNFDINAHHHLSIKVQGAGGNDVETINADRDNNPSGFRVGGASSCQIDLFGGAGTADTVHENYQGDLDGTFGGSVILDQLLDTGQDFADVSAIIDAGSTGSYSNHIEGGLTDDTIFFRIADNQGGRIAHADADAGFNFGDHDTVNHTRNVQVTNAEVDNIVNAPAFANRTVTPLVERGSAAKLSGIITEPDVGDTFFLDVNWGDGTKQTFTYPTGSFVSGQTQVTVEHVYRKAGKYHVRFTWRDQTGLSNDDNSFVVRVVNHIHKPKHDLEDD